MQLLHDVMNKALVYNMSCFGETIFFFNFNILKTCEAHCWPNGGPEQIASCLNKFEYSTVDYETHKYAEKHKKEYSLDKQKKSKNNNNNIPQNN